MTTKVVSTGTKTAITSIDTPASARLGDSIIVDAHIKNLTSNYLNIAATGTYDSTALSFQFDYLNVAPGETVIFRAVFTMPNKSVTIRIVTWWWDGSQWVQDDSGSVNISLISTAAWERLDSKYITINPSTPPPSKVWDRLDSKMLTITPLPPPNVWERLDSKSVTITPQQPSNVWDRLDSKSITISPLEAGGWDKLASTSPVKIFNMDAGIIPPYFKLVMDTTYPEAKTYTGDAQRAFMGFTFAIDLSNFPGANWFIDKGFEIAISNKIKEQGLIPLSMKLYESGRWYIVVAEAGQAPAAYVPLIQVGWTVLVVAALVVIGIALLTVALFKVINFIIKAPGAAIGIGLIIAGVAGVALVGYALSKGTSVKSGITGNVRR